MLPSLLQCTTAHEILCESERRLAALDPTDQMSAFKVAARTDRDSARSLTGLLGEIIEPVATAVSLFEDGDDHWRVEAYYEARPDMADLQNALKLHLADTLAFQVSTLALTKVEDENWVAKSQAALPPVQAGRFFVHGSHDRQKAHGRLNAIEIDAGEAFGTAHHATTEGCLCALSRLSQKRTFGSVLDLGTGSGVLAIAAALSLPRATIAASDIDERATSVAAANIIINGKSGRIDVITADGLGHPRLRQTACFDLVLANILAEPLMQMAPRLVRVSQPGANLVLSGILLHQAAPVIAAYRAAGCHVLRKLRIEGWATLVLVKRTAAAS